MAIVCDCDDSSLQNTGLPNCVPKFGVTKKIIMVPLYANDGTANFIDLTATLDAAYFNAFINHADSSKRWYPIPGEIKNVESTKSENITEGFNDGSKQFVAEGIRSFKAIFPGLNQITAGQLKASRCSQFGIYEIDNASSLLGYTNNETGKLYPITVDENTWAPVWNKITDTTVEKVTLNFEFPSSMLDEYLSILPSSDITGINLLNVNGLIDVESTNVSCIAGGSTTVWIVKLFTKYGTKVKGLVAADFAVYNVTDSAAKTISSVSESTGTYTITISSVETVTDVLRLTPTKTGYDFTAVIANTDAVA